MAHIWITVVLLLLTILHLSSSGSAGDWKYHGEKGSHKWHEAYEECGGLSQSPINLETGLSQFDPSLPEVVVQMPAESVGRMILIHNGHTLQVNTIGDYYVHGGGLPSNYRMAQFHLHWGTHNKKGSEHQIDSHYFPMELHVVSFDYMNYSSIGQAMKAPMGLAVLGTLFSISEEDNPAIEPLISAAEEVQDPDERDTTEIVTMRLKDLLPSDTSRYYRYNGSLTTPGCYESVVWTIFEEKQTISKRQIRILREILQPSDNHSKLKNRKKVADNFRPLQPLHGRQLLRSFPVKGDIPTAALKSHHAVWSYKGDTGPANWMAVYPDAGCGGENQSPINIAEDQTKYDDTLADFIIESPPPETNRKMSVKNNGHTIKVSVGDSGDYYVRGGGLPDSSDYKVAQLHFHWGGEDNKGSEHHVNGHAYPIELHIVTFDSAKYPSISDAVTQPRGLAVLGVLFEVDHADNPSLHPILDVLESVADPEHDREESITALSLDDLLPSDTSQFFRYDGSLTTPGCFESVVWTVFKTTQKLSHKQLREFRNVLKHQDDHEEEVLSGGEPAAQPAHAGTDGHPDTEPAEGMVMVGSVMRERLINNYRPLQPINDRIILRSYKHIGAKRRRGGSHSHHWSYKGQTGPDHWHKMHEGCTGQQQSPINIVTADTEYNPQLTEFSLYDSPDTQSEMAISNNGHTVTVNIKKGVHYVFGGGLPGTYTTAQLHFHWGSSDDQGSEHTVNQHRFPLELHVVNYDSGKYDTIQEAADKPQGLAVLGTLFYLSGDDNPVLKPILDSFDNILDPDHKVERPIPALRIEELIPSDTSRYYRYNGSLTTPGCYESVIWTLFEEKMPISSDQMERFREILLPMEDDENGDTTHSGPHGDTANNDKADHAPSHMDLKPVEVSNNRSHTRMKMVDNFRPVQPLNDRKIWRSFQFKAKKSKHWSYEGQAGPSNWATLHSGKNCNGQRQSPINIQRNRTVFDSNLRDLNIWYDPPLPGSRMVLKNNGHTVQVNLHGKYFVTGAGLTKVYKTAQFHFHWGSSANKGSEHTIDDQAFPLELHIVNYDWETYSNISEAITKPNGLAVLGVFFRLSNDDNPVLQAIIDSLHEVEDPNADSEVELEPMSVKYFLPADRSRYYRYNGSLTTPGCYESVIWTVFEQAQTISMKQLKKFWKMFQMDHDDDSHPGPSYATGSDKPADDTASSPTHRRKHDKHHKHHKGRKRIRTNYRPVQELNERQVYRSFQPVSTGRSMSKDLCDGTNNLSPHFGFIALLLLISISRMFAKL